MSALLEFWSFSDPAATWVLLAAVLLGATAGAVGCFTFLQKRSLIGDALAHAALPGVCTSFMLFSSRSPIAIYIGAILACLLAAWFIQLLTTRTKIKQDSALAIVLSVFFAIGAFQLTIIQKDPRAAKAGLENLLFGKAAAMTMDDLKVLVLVSVSSLLFISLFFQKLKILVFDPLYFRSRALGGGYLESMLWFVVVITIVTGLQLAGVVLIAALVLTPAAAARFWTNSLISMLAVAAIFGAVSGALGANISFLIPGMPTGPWMVVVASSIFIISALFAPNSGFLHRFLKRRAVRWQIREENLLRTLFKLGGEKTLEFPLVNWEEAGSIRKFSSTRLEQILKSLSRKGQIVLAGEACRLTEAGLSRAVELTRFHRLWEVYLTKEVNIAADHVHEDAEEVEHVITPDLEQALIESLGEASEDPHGQPIPRAPKRKERVDDS